MTLARILRYVVPIGILLPLLFYGFSDTTEGSTTSVDLSCGVRTWTKTYIPSSDADAFIPLDVQVDSTGAVVVTGHIERGIEEPIAYLSARKFNAQGELLWDYAHHDGVSPYRFFSPQQGRKSAIGADNSVYLLGSVGAMNEADILVIKLTSSGEVAWEYVFDGGSGGDDTPISITATAQYVYVYGIGQPFVLILSPDGELVGSQTFEHGYNPFHINLFAVDSSGRYVVAGTAYTTDTNGAVIEHASITKYTVAGDVVWASMTPLTEAEGAILELKLDLHDNIYIIRESSRIDEENHIVSLRALQKFDPDGNKLWSSIYRVIGIEYPVLDPLAVSDAGDVFVLGLPEDPNAPLQIQALRYSSTGTLLNQFVSPLTEYPGYPTSLGVHLGADGNVNIWGLQRDIVDFESVSRVTLMRYMPGGSRIDLLRYEALDIPPILTTDHAGIPIIASEMDDATLVLTKADDGSREVPYARMDDFAFNYDYEHYILYRGPTLRVEHPVAQDTPFYFNIIDGSAATGNDLVDLHSGMDFIQEGQDAAAIRVASSFLQLIGDQSQPAYSVDVWCVADMRIVDNMGRATLFDPTMNGLGRSINLGKKHLGASQFDLDGNLLISSSDGLAKMAPDGVLIWETPPPGDDIYFTQIAINVSGIFALGQYRKATYGENGVEDRDIVVAKYTHDGLLLWLAYYDAADRHGGYGRNISVDVAQGFVLDESGRVFVSGQLIRQNPYPKGDDDGFIAGDSVIMALDATGTIAWEYIHDSGGTEFPGGIGIDDQNYVYAIGSSTFLDGPAPRYWLKFGPDGILHGQQYLYTADPFLTSSRSKVIDSRIDRQGNFLTLIYDFERSTGNVVVSLARITPEGDIAWTSVVKRFSGGNAPAVYANLIVTANKEIVVGGAAIGIVAFRADGSLKWEYNAQQSHDFPMNYVTLGPDQLLYSASQAGIGAMTLDGDVRWWQALPADTRDYAFAGVPIQVAPDGRLVMLRMTGRGDESTYSSALDFIDSPVGINVLALNDITVRETYSGTFSLQYPVRLSRITDHDITLAYGFVSASARDGADYSGVDGVLTILAGQQEAMIDIAVLNNGDSVLWKSFYLNVLALNGAILADGNAKISILDAGASVSALPLIVQ